MSFLSKRNFLELEGEVRMLCVKVVQVNLGLKN